ncbi:helix-turn-helix transcriptional regulator [Rhodococcus sp. NPDC057014]|uniref:helix-turn-helix transcriptional regulator n=1 Tax=Rhodococcus sp. NPDC057014 TaxID=3346000 RepID=UPI003630D647
MDATPRSDVSAVSALGEPVRRQVYDHVRTQPSPVSRDDVAEALGLARSTSAFHLEKLADEGLLAVEFARRGGRSGPGAGRPAKLYRRSEREFSVHLPERAYALAGELLARAIEDAEATGASPRDALAARAHDFGRGLGADIGCSDDDLVAALAGCGYEPRSGDAAIVLLNCPFHALARQHTDMVCGMNLALLSGLLDGAGCEDRRATLAPAEGYCCVRIDSPRE